jgi:hypothetical protein
MNSYESAGASHPCGVVQLLMGAQVHRSVTRLDDELRSDIRDRLVMHTAAIKVTPLQPCRSISFKV